MIIDRVVDIFADADDDEDDDDDVNKQFDRITTAIISFPNDQSSRISSDFRRDQIELHKKQHSPFDLD
jgi:hypothetical protein